MRRYEFHLIRTLDLQRTIEALCFANDASAKNRADQMFQHGELAWIDVRLDDQLIYRRWRLP